MKNPEERTDSKLDPFEPVKTTVDVPTKADTDLRNMTPITQPRSALVQVQVTAPTTDEATLDEDADEPEDDRYLDRATD